MKRKGYVLASVLMATTFLTACGGSSNTTTVSANLPPELQGLSPAELQARADEANARVVELQERQAETEEQRRLREEEQRIIEEEREAQRLAEEAARALIPEHGEPFQGQWATVTFAAGFRNALRFAVEGDNVTFLSIWDQPNGIMEIGTYGAATFSVENEIPVMTIISGDITYRLEINPRWTASGLSLINEGENALPTLMFRDNTDVEDLLQQMDNEGGDSND